MSLKHCPTCNGKVDSESPFCPHCNKLKPKEGWWPVIVKPTKYKNITIILPSCGFHETLVEIDMLNKLKEGHQFDDGVRSDFYKQLKKEASRQLVRRDYGTENEIRLKFSSTQTINLKIPYQSGLLVRCSKYYKEARGSFKLESDDNLLYEEGIYQINVNYFDYIFTSKYEGGYSITKIK
ncbi:MAG: hypothetical protein ACI4GB_08270 [Acutalibacteraceae bacterium]